MRRRLGCRSCGRSLLMLTAGCRRNQNNEPAVATPSLSFSKDRVPIGSAVTLTYSSQVAPNASFDKNYYVFVHVLDPEGEQMWTDDHLPPVPTSQWKPGQTIEYSRTIFVPELSVHRRSDCAARPLRPGVGKPPDAERAGRVAAGYIVTKFQCCRRPRTSSCVRGAAGTQRKWTQRTRRTSGSGRRRPRRSRSGIRRRIPRLIWTSTRGPTCSTRPSR